MQFLLPKEPRLLWSMLYPRARRQAWPFPLPGQLAYGVFWARNAIYHGLKALGISPGDKVLAPSYHCAAAIEPILQYGAKVVFYNIHRDCSPDLHDLQAKIDHRTRAVLAIHYFGFPQPIRMLQELCKQRQLYLIEDCAHVLTGEVAGAALGTFGDISVFSWRKFFPLYDGGHLIVNHPNGHADIPWEKNTLLFSLKVAKNLLEKLLDDSPLKGAKIIRRFLHLPYLAARRMLPNHQYQRKEFTIHNNSHDFDLSLVNVPMSSFSSYIMQNIDLSLVVAKRRSNYTFFLKAIEELPGIAPCFSSLPEGICPWVFPVIVPKPSNVHVALRSRGIPAFAWNGVIHQTLPLEKFPDAAFLYQHLILLPVHQNIEETDIRTIVKVLSEILHNGC